MDPFVAPIGHVDESFRVDGHAGGPLELAFAFAGTAESGHELAVIGEFLDAVVAPIGDINIVVAVHCRAPGQVELPLAASERPPIGDELAL